MTIKQLFWLLRWLAFIPLALVWVLFTYFVFAKLLYITLPIGSLWTTLF